MTTETIGVEIYDGENIHSTGVSLRSSSDLETPGVSVVINRICKQLLDPNVKYSVLLENLTHKIVVLSDSYIGSVTYLTDNQLLCVALGEKDIGTVIPQYMDSQKTKKASDNLFGYAIENNVVVISHDIRNDPRAAKDIPPDHPPIKNFMAIPLSYQKCVIGVLSLTREENTYTSDDFQQLLPLIDICASLLHKSCTPEGTMASRIRQTSSIDEAKDRFLATMSHELRTPLNGIMGMVKMFPDIGPLNPKQKEYLQNLTECSVSLANLLNNILDFSKMSADRLVLKNIPLTISEVVSESLMMVEGNILSKGLELKVDIPEGYPSFLGDKTRVVQILSNLLSNSAKFTTKGSISIKTDAKPLQENNGHTPLRKWRIAFTIEDTGVGIPLEEQDKIFESFHQSSSLSTYMSSSGTGLGLSIVRELVRLMDGKITVSSQGVEGKGTTFSFYIILSEEVNIAALQEKYAQDIKDSRILIVDDRPEIRLQLTDMLFKWNCIPQAVSSAEEALQYLQHNIKFDAALIDINMPEMSGVELAQELRIRYKKLPLIGISSVELSSGEEYFDYYMYKPIDRNILFPALVNCLSRKNSVPRSPPRRRQYRRSKLKILVAEDDPHNQYTMKEMLLNLKFFSENIKIVNDGKECVEAVKEFKPHVVLMDVVMPNMDGIEATRRIKRFSDVMIIAVSAAVQASDKAKCHHAGIGGYLTKPLSKEKLDGALSIMVRKSKHKKKKGAPNKEG